MKKTLIILSLCIPVTLSIIPQTSLGALTAPVTSPFYYTFNESGILNEVGALFESASPYWWVNSGGVLTLTGDVGGTNQGDLPLLSPWRLTYSISNPGDTDNGTHPQNIFRLVSRSKWQNVKEEVYFKIVKDNLSSSSNRNSSNGFLLFGRYQDSDNLYYAGIRVDGAAVIKKKIAGKYYTLAYEKIFPGIYNRSTNANLLPKNTWVGLRTEIKNNADGSVSINLYMDKEKTGTWSLVLSAKDDGKSYGGKAITETGYLGIRADFMDVWFDTFIARTL